MARGQRSALGDERTSPNGYRYVRTMGGWRLKHQIIAEKALGRPLRENERCKFRDNDRTNLDPSNIEVVLKREKSNGTKRAQLEAKIEQLQAELAELDEE